MSGMKKMTHSRDDSLGISTKFSINLEDYGNGSLDNPGSPVHTFFQIRVVK